MDSKTAHGPSSASCPKDRGKVEKSEWKETMGCKEYCLHLKILEMHLTVWAPCWRKGPVQSKEP